MSACIPSDFSFCKEDPTRPGCQSCRIESNFPNCSDPFCRERVCSQLNQTQCCQEAWDVSCSEVASVLCTPEVVPMFEENYCPSGYVCNEDLTYKALCSEIRQVPHTILFGDLFSGIICPNATSTMKNCPRGKYCPSSTEELDCPAGKFCPFKTAQPLITCDNCEAGATEMERDVGVVTALIVLIIAIVAGIIVSVIYKRSKQKLYEQYETFTQMAKSINGALLKNDSQIRMEKIRPKLAVIAKRLDDMGSDTAQKLIRKSSEKKLVGGKNYARDLFDAMDTNGDGLLQFSELNVVMGLEKDELELFVASMTKATKAATVGNMEDDSVSRPIFVNNFFKALEGTVNLKVTPDEAAAIYDSILKDNDASTEVQEQMMYTSVLSNTLSDPEILLLIKKFRNVRTIDEEWGGRRGSIRRRVHVGIAREAFILHYPTFLMQVFTETDNTDSSEGVDICFKDLCLQVTVAKQEINVVNNVTGRLRAKTMTALMGGSGAGKTSLLNALCGRAYYGNIIGDTFINGKMMQIEEIKDLIGFVPQDDIVYAELTVRENLIYAGKLSLPRGTSLGEIEDLADTTLANLGLSRVTDSLVGDVKRRGVSGGEKKRVNIGLELMSRPRCLFLDEPTSGLDSSSALLVMSSLKNLVSSEGVTIVTVIHQPRKFIFDLFDSLILLGVGGNTVYSGPAKEAYDYFTSLNYVLPAGEALADWFIDISSGQMHPDQKVAATKKLEYYVESDGEDDEEDDEEELVAISPRMMTEAVGKKGVAMGKAREAITDAALRREWLYDEWKKYFNGPLKDEQREMYAVPAETAVPGAKSRQSFFSQLTSQMSRIVLVSYRNMNTKLFETMLLVVAAFGISVLIGLPNVSVNNDPNIAFEDLVAPDKDKAMGWGVQLFQHAITLQMMYPLLVGLITAVLVGLLTSRAITSKRLEFFRETSSGYNANAYLLAVNIMATIETSIQVILVALVSAMLREPITSWRTYFVHFLAMAWTVVSWSLLFPMIIPGDIVITAVGAFLTFFGLILSGAVPPISMEMIYTNAVVEHIAAWLSVTRFFAEGLAASEHRCLPEQSGWTVDLESVNFPRSFTLMRFNRFSYGMHDPNLTIYDCDGWYWGILPSIFVGITIRYLGFLAMHGLNRGQQTKKPVLHEIKKDKKCGILVFVLFLVFCALASITTWSYTRDLDPDYAYSGIDKWIESDDELRKNLMELSQYLNDTNYNVSYIPTLLDLNQNLDTSSLAKSPIPIGVFPEDSFEDLDDTNFGNETFGNQTI